jgi:hypothetical protein
LADGRKPLSGICVATVVAFDLLGDNILKGGEYKEMEAQMRIYGFDGIDEKYTSYSCDMT